MKTIAMTIGIVFFIFMLISVLTVNSKWAGQMNNLVKRFFYRKEGDEV